MFKLFLLESVTGEKIFFLYLFGKNNNNNKITSRCLSNFKGSIVSYLSAALSSEQRPLFLVTLLFSETVVLGDPKLNPVKGEIASIAGNESHRNRWIRIIKSLGYSKNIRYAFAADIKPQLTFLQTMEVLPPFWTWQCHVVARSPIRHFSPVNPVGTGYVRTYVHPFI